MESISAEELGDKAKSKLDWYELLTVDSKHSFHLAYLST